MVETPTDIRTLRKKKTRKTWLVRLAIGVLAFIAFLMLMDMVIMPLYVKRGEKGIVPKVLGKPVEIAMKQLSDAGFDPIKYETAFDEKVKEGIVIRQTPEGGEETKPARKIYLIISGGKEMVIVPDLRGKTLNDARIAIVKANLELGKTDYIFADSTTSGTVYKQSPDPGTKISSSKRVDLVVTQGARTGKVAVPNNLIGISHEEATRRLALVNLRVGKVTLEERGEGKVGMVYETYPSAGDLIDIGAMVDLFIVKEKVAPKDAQEGGQ